MPVPKPCSTPDQNTGVPFICALKRVIIHSEVAVMAKPLAMITRVSILPIRRPTSIIASSVPMLRGAVSKPASYTG